MIYFAVTSCEKTKDSQHAAAYALLHSILRELGHNDAEIKKAESGRPYVDISNTDISISHSGEAVAVAVTSPVEADTDIAVILPFSCKSIGIDIEEIKTGSLEKKQRIAERFLKASISEEREFYRLWTRNEAFGKMTGEGVLTKKDCPSHILTFTVELCGKDYSLSISVE